MFQKHTRSVFITFLFQSFGRSFQTPLSLYSEYFCAPLMCGFPWIATDSRALTRLCQAVRLGSSVQRMGTCTGPPPKSSTQSSVMSAIEKLSPARYLLRGMIRHKNESRIYLTDFFPGEGTPGWTRPDPSRGKMPAQRRGRAAAQSRGPPCRGPSASPLYKRRANMRI